MCGCLLLFLAVGLDGFGQPYDAAATSFQRSACRVVIFALHTFLGLVAAARLAIRGVLFLCSTTIRVGAAFVALSGDGGSGCGLVVRALMIIGTGGAAMT